MRSRVLVTGMSGTGKSTVLSVLGERGHRVVDTDTDEWCRWVTLPDGSADWIWREDAMATLLDGHISTGALFVAGCKTNQGAFYPRFEHVVLLSAPAEVILARIATRATNPYGQDPKGYPFPWAVRTWLPGEDALSGRFRSLVDTATALGRFVAELRSIDATDGPVGGRGGPLVRRDGEFRSALSQCDGLLDVGRAAAVWDDALAAPPWDGPPVWLHADLIPGNLLVREGRLAGVLDFGTVTTGDPAYDVTAAWHILGGASRPAFLDLVGADEPTRRRARGLVLSGGVIALPYYLHTNPAMIATARTGIDAVFSSGG